MIADGIGEALGCFFTIAIVAIIATIGYTGYFIYDKIGEQTIESKVLITPEIKLEVNDNKVDTIYVYKIK